MNDMSPGRAAEISSAVPPQPRAYSGFNWPGFRTLYLREVKRFWKVGTQTLAAPVVTSLLYMMVFVVAVGGARPDVHGVPFATFIAPGLIMMTILNNAFANSSSSLLQAKVNGLVGDFMTPPLTPLEHVAGFALGAATRGLAVGAVTWIAVLPFADLPLTHLWAVLYFAVAASLILGMLGMMAGLWAEKFDHMAAVTNFIIMPMTFLSGTFYLVDRLPEPFRTASHFNPFFYLIDGFRYGFIGQAEGSLVTGIGMTAGIAVAFAFVCLWMFETGYKLKT
ncbi:ABC transporter permease [Phenylobacterium sp.]|uniref:ABC transporter permease n=1 Tax=Phenylobacterium sp. TaxID=1871053 RepID=UPI0017B04A20|nr:ABC transporter permease [Phenylobacterium sp.]MBA4793014.1 ABC transporter permease [Phenylobacterium sp.]MBC7168786.1 ABC transporter permease [Phenylobacterium sp.]